MGAGVGSSIFAQISRTSTEKGRASALSTASGARQIGLLLGPALNFPLNSLDFYIGPFHVNKFSGPGVSQGETPVVGFVLNLLKSILLHNQTAVMPIMGWWRGNKNG